MIRGPYRKPKKLTVKEKTWHRGDVVQVNGTRWIIRILRTGEVILRASNVGNCGITWTTTLDRLPEKASTP